MYGCIARAVKHHYGFQNTVSRQGHDLGKGTPRRAVFVTKRACSVWTAQIPSEPAKAWRGLERFDAVHPDAVNRQAPRHGEDDDILHPL